MATLASNRSSVAPMTSSFAPRMLSVLRIVTAFLFFLHGTAKILDVPFQPQYVSLPMYSLVSSARAHGASTHGCGETTRAA